jgi:hypothetical protein
LVPVNCALFTNIVEFQVGLVKPYANQVVATLVDHFCKQSLTTDNALEEVGVVMPNCAVNAAYLGASHVAVSGGDDGPRVRSVRARSSTERFARTAHRSHRRVGRMALCQLEGARLFAAAR